MMSKKDPINHYGALELPHNCTQKEISASFKRLALLHHPDKVVGDKAISDHFCQIQEAREVLQDPERRLLYDQTLSLRSTFISRGYRKRYRPSDNPRSENFEQESCMPCDSKSPPEEYIYTWGSSVHMNLNSEWAQAEIARHAKELDEWEMRFAGTGQANYGHDRQFKEGQASPEGDAIVNEDGCEDGFPRPSSEKRTPEANEDGSEHGHIDPEVQKSNEKLYAYGMKGGVPSDYEECLTEGASEDASNAWLGNDHNGDGPWKMKYNDYFNDAESKAGSDFSSATGNASPLIDLSDDHQGYEAILISSKDNKAKPLDDSKPATHKEGLINATEVPGVIAANVQDNANSTNGSIGCFIDLSGDEQDHEANHNLFKENKIEPPDNSKKVFTRLPNRLLLLQLTSRWEQLQQLAALAAWWISVMMSKTLKFSPTPLREKPVSRAN
ncbi:DnaJ-domain-containing protein [Penicillium longicatenatum]|nr:DnaJ-domain-containing protein [Penicillium longicatenatum]